ncbi:hypothetical protein NKDENANG_01348 [Candidatus Entotheonellaceae bacterium PAL068K]
MRRLPDYLQANLHLVFVSFNPRMRSGGGITTPARGIASGPSYTRAVYFQNLSRMRTIAAYWNSVLASRTWSNVPHVLQPTCRRLKHGPAP